jgi:hypothetical protein
MLLQSAAPQLPLVTNRYFERNTCSLAQHEVHLPSNDAKMWSGSMVGKIYNPC